MHFNICKKIFLKLTILCFCILRISLFSSAQDNKLTTRIELESNLASDSILPFWITANQNGKYLATPNVQQLGIIERYQRSNIFNSKLSFNAGANLYAGYSGQLSLNLNQLFVKLHLYGWKLEGGWFADNENFNGLSTTNGNIARSVNYKPYPKVRFATDGYIPALIWKDWFSFSAEYDEGWLNDNRYVNQPHMHHKSLYTRYKLGTSFLLRVGLDHFVMWGGTSPEESIGKMPDDFESYLIYITGQSGNDKFPQTDQRNVSGNQYGAYLLQLDYIAETYKLTLNLSHPFDDHSGMELQNWEDNLYGLNLDFKDKHRLINQILIELTCTKKQGLDSLYEYRPDRGWVKLHDDDYFNHTVYRSGVTYKQKAMVSPLFAPVILENNISRGFENSRFISGHLGIKGKLTEQMNWKTLITYTSYFGTWKKPLEPSKNQFSCLLSFDYCNTKIPFNIGLSLAADAGQVYNNNFGVQLKLFKTFN